MNAETNQDNGMDERGSTACSRVLRTASPVRGGGEESRGASTGALWEHGKRGLVAGADP